MQYCIIIYIYIYIYMYIYIYISSRPEPPETAIPRSASCDAPHCRAADDNAAII